MDQRRHQSKDSLPYSNLFNLEVCRMGSYSLLMGSLHFFYKTFFFNFGFLIFLCLFLLGFMMN